MTCRRLGTTRRCPGHGTVVEDTAGRSYLLYHAYPATSDFPYVGRVALLDLVEWRADGWPTINAGRGPSRVAPAPAGVGNTRRNVVVDEFEGERLDASWRWPTTPSRTPSAEMSFCMNLSASD